MRVQGSHGRNRQGLRAQESRTGVNGQIRLELTDYFE